jgi:hypothetical protein
MTLAMVQPTAVGLCGTVRGHCIAFLNVVSTVSKRVLTAVVGPEVQDTTVEWRTLHHESRFVTR